MSVQTKNKGIRQYTGEEASNVSLGQLGFVKCDHGNNNVVGACPKAAIGGAPDPAANTYYYPDVRQWVGVKNVDDTENATISVKGPGTMEPVAPHAPDATSKEVKTDVEVTVTDIDLVPGDVLYGPFTEVDRTAGSCVLILIKG